MSRGRASILAWACALWAACACAAGTTRVQGIEVSPGGAAVTHVRIALSDTTRFHIFTLRNPERVVIDLEDASISPSALPLPRAQGPIRDARFARRPGGTLRLVLDTAVPVQAQGRMGIVPSGPQLLLRLGPPGSAAPGASVAEPRSPEASKPERAAPAPVAMKVATALEPAAAAPVAEPPAAAPPAEPAARPKTAAAPRRQSPAGGGRDLVIAVDAGHGGKDPGARGARGTREKDVTLAISKRLTELLAREPGMRGVMTRKGDEFVVLRDRMERARAAKSDLFVSIHADAARDRRAHGATVYVLSEKGATDEAARRLAARENAADLIGGVDLGNKDQMLASVLLDLSQNAALSSSIEAGDAVLVELGRITPLKRRKVQQAPFLVLKSPDVPSMLVETAYISNPQEERNLGSRAHQQKIAEALLAGIRNYFAANPPDGTLFASATGRDGSIRHVIRRGDTLSGIASRYNVSVQKIRVANHLSGDRVMVGQVLQIPLRQDI